MENNKAYLLRIHWVFLAAAVYSLSFIFLEPWLRKTFDPDTAYIVRAILRIGILYGGLIMVTSRWKEAAIAFGIAAVLYIIDFTADIKLALSWRLIIFFIYPIPIVVFVALQTGWRKRIWQLYVLSLCLTNAAYMDYYVASAMETITDTMRIRVGNLWQMITVFIATSSIITFGVIAVCELINYVKGKTYTNKSVLLNLGNDYGKLQSVVTFWVLKVSLFAIILGNARGLYYFLDLMSEDRGFYMTVNDEIRQFYIYLSGPVMLCFIAVAVFTAWYLRKFMIETFINFGIHSKVLYWLSLIPVIGILVYLITILDSTKQQQLYAGRRETLGRFAGSSSAFITSAFFVILFIRLLMRLSSEDPTALIISLVVSILFFIWVISSKMGYYVSLVLISLGMCAILVASFIMSIDGSGGAGMRGDAGLFFGLLVFNMAQLILLYPVYHFEEFEYIPAEDPDAAQVPETLFAQT